MIGFGKRRGEVLERLERAQRIASKAKGPAAKELAWEGWLACENRFSAVGALGEELSRTWFEEWWEAR